MLPIKNREDLDKLKELASIQSQVKDLRLQDKLDEQNFHENLKKLSEPVTDALKNTSENLTKTITENLITNNQTTWDLKENV